MSRAIFILIGHVIVIAKPLEAPEKIYTNEHKSLKLSSATKNMLICFFSTVQVRFQRDIRHELIDDKSCGIIGAITQ